MVTESVIIACTVADRDELRKVTTKFEQFSYVDHFDVRKAFSRRKWREAICDKFGFDDDAHEWLEKELHRAADAADEGRGELWLPVVKKLSEVEACVPDYLWDDRWARKTIICIDGDGGVGKGLSIMDVAARGSRGDAMPPGSAPSGTFDPWNTLLITSEDSAEFVLKPRAVDAGADTSRIITMASVEIPEEDRRSIELLQDIDLIERVVLNHEISLVVIDPYSEFLDAHLNMNSDPDNRRVLGPLAEMAQRTGAAVVLVRHLNKKEGQSAQYRGTGSTAPLNASRAAYLVAPDPSDPDMRVMACTKFNIGPKPKSLRFRIEGAGTTARVCWEGECDITAGELMKTGGNATGGKKEIAKEVIRDVLSKGPRGSREVMQACRDEGVSERTYRTARQELGVLKEKTDFQGEWLLTLPSTNGEAF